MEIEPEISIEKLQAQESRFQTSIDRVKKVSSLYGSPEGPDVLDFSRTSDLEKLTTIKKVGIFRAYIQDKSIPALEKRVAVVQEQIRTHTSTKAFSELEEIRKLFDRGVLNKSDLEEAEKTFANVTGIQAPQVVVEPPKVDSGKTVENHFERGERTVLLVKAAMSADITHFDEVVSKVYDAELVTKSPEEQKMLIARYRGNSRQAIGEFLNKLRWLSSLNLSVPSIVRELIAEVSSNEKFMALSPDERMILATREPGYEPLLAKVLQTEVSKPQEEEEVKGSTIDQEEQEILALMKEIANNFKQEVEEGKSRMFIIKPDGEKYYLTSPTKLQIIAAVFSGTEQSPIPSGILAKAVYYEDYRKGIDPRSLRDRVKYYLNELRSEPEKLGYELMNANETSKTEAQYYFSLLTQNESQTVEPPLSEEEQIALDEAKQALKNIIQGGGLPQDQIDEAIKRGKILFGEEFLEELNPSNTKAASENSAEQTEGSATPESPRIIEYKASEQNKRTPKEERILKTIISGLTTNSRLWFDKVLSGVVDLTEQADEALLPGNMRRRYVDDANSLFAQFKEAFAKLNREQLIPRQKELSSEEDQKLWEDFQNLKSILHIDDHKQLMEKIHDELNRAQRDYLDLKELPRNLRPYIEYYDN